MRREQAIKRFSRARKLGLIERYEHRHTAPEERT
jgi:predicted GIY-YIG superfamily endonuclease